MYRSYRYQFKPTRAQAVELVVWLELGRELYNAALQERRDAWQKQRVSVQLRDQFCDLAVIRALRPEFYAVPIDVLRGWLTRLDLAFCAFFRRCKSGDEKPGFPRFRAAKRFDTIEFNLVAGREPIVAGGKRLKVPLLGKVKFRQHRPIEGVPKSVRITRDGDRWWVTIQCADVPTKALPSTKKDVGIDLGLHTLVATSDHELFDNPRPLRTAEKLLIRTQRKVTRRKKGSNRRHKAALVLRRRHQHVANIRRENAIGVAKSLIARYDTIYVEDLNLDLMGKGKFSKSVKDAAWGTTLHWLRVKAEEAAREVIAVDSRGTSQECSGCGEIVAKDISVRVHHCPRCDLTLDRDVNAARNVLSRGRRDRGGSAGLQRPMIREGSRQTISGVRA